MANQIGDTVSKGNYFNVCTDETNQTFETKSFYTDSEDVKFADGKNAENKMGAIKGITSDFNTTDPGYAASMTSVSQLNSSLGVDIKLIDGVPCWSERGADTWNPFKPTITDYVNWINSLVPLIPKQTDNSNIIGNSINLAPYKGFQAFDEDDYTMWISRSSNNVSPTNPHWIGYKFSEPTSINLIKIIGNATTIPATIQGSNDGSTWTDIKTINVNATTIYHSLEPGYNFLYSRMLFTTHNARWVQGDAVGGPKTFYFVTLYTIQFYN